jgi:puromycin-sensitive aminopeptidase
MKQDIGTMMSTWTRQIGFPLVRVEERTLQGAQRALFLSQERFVADGGAEFAPGERPPLWQVPIGVTVSDSPSLTAYKFMLDQRNDSFVLEGVQPGHWVKV